MPTILQSAATQAQRTLAQLQGMPPAARGNLTGPDGRTYISVPRAADAFERAEAERTMTLHGYQDRAIEIHTLTRTQFSADPLSWRRAKVQLLQPLPVREALVASLALNDPLNYVLILLIKQPA